MQQTILFKASSAASTPIVTLTGLSTEAQSSTPFTVRLCRALFSPKVSAAVAVLCACAIWWHAITVADTAAAQKAVGLDALCAMPWGIVWAIRFTRMPLPQEGGDR